MDRTHAILLVFILQIKCKGEFVVRVIPSYVQLLRPPAQDPCNGNYMTLDPIRIGNRVDLACGCPSGTTTVAWYRDNFNNQTTTITDIYIVNVLSETDGGYYICRCDAHSNCFLLKGKTNSLFHQHADMQVLACFNIHGHWCYIKIP